MFVGVQRISRAWHWISRSSHDLIEGFHQWLNGKMASKRVVKRVWEETKVLEVCLSNERKNLAVLKQNRRTRNPLGKR